MEWGGEPGALIKGGKLYLDICARPRVPSYAIADGTGLPT